MLACACRTPLAPKTHLQGGSGRPCSAAPLPSARTSFRPSPRRRPTVAALPGAEQLQIDGSAKRDLPSWLTLTGYAATLLARGANLTSFQLAAGHIYSALAFYTAVWGLLSLADADFSSSFDTVGSAVGPIFLAVNALGSFGGRLAPFEVAAFLFGFFWVDKLPAFRYSRWVWLATLAAAIYKGLPAEWLVAAFGLSSLWKLVQERSYQHAAFLGLAAWAFYKQVEYPIALLIMAAQIATSAVA